MLIKFVETAKIILSLIPYSSFQEPKEVNISYVEKNYHCKLKPFRCNTPTQYPHEEGFITYGYYSSDVNNTYVMIFTNGIIEVVDGRLLAPNDGNLSIPSIAYEEEIIKKSSEYLNLQKKLGIGVPIYINLWLVGVKDYELALNPEV